MLKFEKPVVICHFSDLHLLPDRSVPVFQLLNKRILGYANLKLNRGRTHKEEYLTRLIREAASEDADLIAVTGDFTSLSLNFEFEKIGRMLRLLGLVPEKTLVVPGNHDRYTMLSDKQRAFERGMAEFLPEGFPDAPRYPIVKRLGSVCLIGLDTAVWRGPVRAAGAIDNEAVERTREILTSEEMKPLTKVVALHHPPVHRGNHMLKNYRTGFDGYERLTAVLPKGTLVIHGHTHIASRQHIGGLDIIGVPSASNNTGDVRTQLAYNKYSFSPDGTYTVEAVRFWPSGDGRDIRTERVMLSADF